MAKTVVMWDLDGVLANFNKAYRSLANDMLWLALDVNARPQSWNELGDTIGAEDDDRIWNRIRQSPNFWRNLDSLATVDEWRRIVDLDAVHYFVTSRPGKETLVQSQDWLFEKFEDNAGQPPEEWSVFVSSRKADAANALGANYTIDDKAGNVLAVYYNSPPQRNVYVYDTPYNQFESSLVGSRVRRVATVSAFLDDVENKR